MMKSLTIIPGRFAPHVLGLLRIVLALLLIPHGTAKLFGVPHVEMFAGVKLMSLLGAAGVIEIAGGALLLVGFQTRLVAFVLSGFMAFAYFLGHAQHGLLPLLNKGELAAVYCFIFLYLSVVGSGKFAIDRS
jgi:putative oxidoreductase